MGATLTCWLNTSPTKPVIWLKDKSGLLKGNPFLNLASKGETEMLVDILREAFTRGVSFEVIVDTSDIQTRSNGSLSVSSTLANILATMVETVKAEPKPVDAAAVAKAEALLASLRTRPAVSTSVASDPFDDLEAF